MDTFKKISASELEVTHPEVTEVVKTTYERSFIERQILTITADRDSYVASRNKEIAECVAILAEMTKLGILTKEEVIIK